MSPPAPQQSPQPADKEFSDRTGPASGLKVSSLDESGPQWPFTVAWLAGAAAHSFAAVAIYALGRENRWQVTTAV